MPGEVLVGKAENRGELADRRRQLEEARARIAELEAMEAHRLRTERALRRSREHLEQVLAERRRVEATLAEQAHRLEERVKELDCLYGISQLIERPGISLPQIVQGIVDLLPAAWQYPEVACACALLEGQRFATANHVESPWKQSCEIVVHGRVAGHLQVCYLEARPERDEGPFLKEERSLLQAAAERLGRIVERKGIERELRVKDSAIASSINAIALADLQADLTYANTAFLRLWGYDDEGEVLGRPVVSFWHEEEEAAAIVAALRTEGSWVGELVARRKDGSPFDVQLSASVVTDGAGQPVRLMASFVDITERKRVEEALLHYAAELQARNEELDAFARTVAHDLKNPLTRIIGFAELLKEEYETFTGEEMRQWLGIIRRDGHRMRGIVDELLFLSSVRQAGDVAVQPLDTAAIVAEVLDRLAPMIEEHQGEVRVPGTWPEAYGYAPWIEQVWANYLSNAVKYGGRPPQVELGADRRRGLVRFWVRDNGPGLSREQQARLFTPFTRLDAARAEGYGLGLSIVQRIAEKLGGEVGVESEPGRGSLFYIELPQAGRE